MPNRRPYDYIGNSKFKIEIGDVTVASFAAVDGIEARTEVITYVDGNEMMVHKRPGRTTYSNIIFKRGYVNTDELWKWYKAVVNGKVERKTGSIVVMDEALSDEVFRYTFFDAWPCRWKSLELDALKPGSLIEELEVVVEMIERG